MSQPGRDDEPRPDDEEHCARGGGASLLLQEGPGGAQATGRRRGPSQRLQRVSYPEHEHEEQDPDVQLRQQLYAPEHHMPPPPDRLPRLPLPADAPAPDQAAILAASGRLLSMGSGTIAQAILRIGGGLGGGSGGPGGDGGGFGGAGPAAAFRGLHEQGLASTGSSFRLLQASLGSGSLASAPETAAGFAVGRRSPSASSALPFPWGPAGAPQGRSAAPQQDDAPSTSPGAPAPGLYRHDPEEWPPEREPPEQLRGEPAPGWGSLLDAQADPGQRASLQTGGEAAQQQQQQPGGPFSVADQVAGRIMQERARQSALGEEAGGPSSGGLRDALEGLSSRASVPLGAPGSAVPPFAEQAQGGADANAPAGQPSAWMSTRGSVTTGQRAHAAEAERFAGVSPGWATGGRLGFAPGTISLTPSGSLGLPTPSPSAQIAGRGRGALRPNQPQRLLPPGPAAAVPPAPALLRSGASWPQPQLPLAPPLQPSHSTPSAYDPSQLLLQPPKHDQLLTPPQPAPLQPLLQSTPASDEAILANLPPPVHVTVAASTAKRGKASQRSELGWGDEAGLEGSAEPASGRRGGQQLRRKVVIGDFVVELHGELSCEVLGVFYPRRYMEGRDCVEYPAQSGTFISRSHFEKIGGAVTAKWYRSIRVLPQLEHLGDWLERHGLPVFKGSGRRRLSRATARRAALGAASGVSSAVAAGAVSGPVDSGNAGPSERRPASGGALGGRDAPPDTESADTAAGGADPGAGAAAGAAALAAAPAATAAGGEPPVVEDEALSRLKAGPGHAAPYPTHWPPQAGPFPARHGAPPHFPPSRAVAAGSAGGPPDARAPWPHWPGWRASGGMSLPGQPAAVPSGGPTDALHEPLPDPGSLPAPRLGASSPPRVVMRQPAGPGGLPGPGAASSSAWPRVAPSAYGPPPPMHHAPLPMPWPYGAEAYEAYDVEGPYGPYGAYGPYGPHGLPPPEVPDEDVAAAESRGRPSQQLPYPHRIVAAPPPYPPPYSLHPARPAPGHEWWHRAAPMPADVVMEAPAYRAAYWPHPHEPPAPADAPQPQLRSAAAQETADDRNYQEAQSEEVVTHHPEPPGGPQARAARYPPHRGAAYYPAGEHPASAPYGPHLHYRHPRPAGPLPAAYYPAPSPKGHPHGPPLAPPWGRAGYYALPPPLPMPEPGHVPPYPYHAPARRPTAPPPPAGAALGPNPTQPHPQPQQPSQGLKRKASAEADDN